MLVELKRVSKTRPYLKKIGHTYAGAGSKSVMVTNNISAMDAVFGLNRDDISPNKITAVRTGANVTDLLPAAFQGCTNLTSFTAGSKLTSIADNAFFGCRGLAHVNLFEPNCKQKLNIIGVSAFANTKLRDVTLHMTGVYKTGEIVSTSYYSDIGAYAFAGCTELTHVKYDCGNFLADYQFAGCTSLTSIDFSNSHSFAGDYSFFGCTALRSVTIPASTYGLGTGMFQNCSNLKTITFNEPSQLGFMNCIGDNFLLGTAVESITFPSSITSFTHLSPYALHGMPNLKEVRFNGMISSQIFSSIPHTESVQTIFKYNVIYHCNAFAHTTPLPDIISEHVDENTFLKIYSIADAYHIPVISMVSDPGGCPNCNSFDKSVGDGTEMASFLADLKKPAIYFMCSQDRDSAMWRALRQKVKYSQTKYVSLQAYWMDKNGVVHTDESPSHMTRMEAFKTQVARFFSSGNLKDYDPSQLEEQQENTVLVEASLTNTDGFGVGHNIEIYSKDGQHITFVAAHDGNPPGIMYNQHPQVDNITGDDFRKGQWYSNARAVHEFAVAHNYAVVVECGTESCPPCEDFLNRVFSNNDFQTWIRSQNVLLVKISASSLQDENFVYTMSTWFKPEFSATGKMPIIMAEGVQRKTDGTNAMYSRVQYYAHYNNENDTDKPNMPLVNGPDSVKNWLVGKLALPAFTGAAAVPAKPAITQYGWNEDDGYPNRFMRYDNQPNDDHGRYFPVKRLVDRSAGESTSVTVLKQGGGKTTAQISHMTTTVDIAPGTYQYFMGSDSADPDFEMNYDQNGVIFKIGSQSDVSTSEIETVEYASNQTVAQLLAALSIAATSVTQQTAVFESDVYVINDDDTYDISRYDPDYIPAGESPYNMTQTITVNSGQTISYKGSSLDRIDLLLLTQPAYDPAVDDAPYQKAGAAAYVVEATFYGREQISGNRLIWIKNFYNY